MQALKGRALIEQNMIYRSLGNTGIKASIIGFGNYINAHEHKALETQIDIVNYCWKQGINFFDTAEVYGFGEAERIMGNAIESLGADRSDLVITTKIFWGDQTLNQRGNSRKHLFEGIRKSLKNLRLDYVDIVFSHRPDYETPLEEICRGFSDIVSQGYSFYWGTSEWRPEMIIRAIEICRKNSWNEPVVEQPQYNMLVRDRMEKEYEYLFKIYKYGTTVWSPLCQGILTGKYNDGNAPEGSRFFSEDEKMKKKLDKYFGEDKQKTIQKFKELSELSQELGYTQAQLALAWVLANQDVSVALVGSSKLSQIEDNIKAIELLKKWTSEIENRVEKILGNRPDAEINFKTWTPEQPRRVQSLFVNEEKK